MISTSIFIDRNINTVYDTFYDLSHWLRVLPDIIGVDMFYDDSRHQEFSMTVERPNGMETIRGIRFCERNSHLHLFQPQPPPGFSMMSGTWRFDVLGQGTIVKVYRNFKLSCSATDADQLTVAKTNNMKLMLLGYLDKNLSLFKLDLEQ